MDYRHNLEEWAGFQAEGRLDELSERRLPTPTRRDYKDGEVRREPHRPDAVDTLSRALTDVRRLPTPAVLDKDFDATGTAKAREESGKQMHLAHILGRDLLQTPAAADSGGGRERRGGERSDELLLPGQAKALLPTPNPFHSGNTESPEEWLERRAEVEARTGTRHGPALPVVAWSITDGHPLSQDGDGPRLHEPEVKRLPTPDAYQGKRGGSQDPEKRRAGKHAVSLADVGEKGLKRLPTPRAGDGPEASSHGRTYSATDFNMHNAVRMLPTPKATNNENRPSEGFGTGGVGYTIAHTDWAQYGPAIRIWEQVMGRPAPPPTIAGKRGEPRLNPALTEWMMGLPEGHITSVPGLSREAQLKAAGNGVVPQQAAAALMLLVTDLVPLVTAYASEEGEALGA